MVPLRIIQAISSQNGTITAESIESKRVARYLGRHALLI